MFPKNYPLNGPGSSFDISSNRIALATAISNLDSEINLSPTIANPEYTNIVQPILPNSLNVGLPSGSFVIDGKLATIAPVSLLLTGSSEVFVNATTVGLNNIADFTSGSSLLYLSTGSYSGNYYIQSGSAIGSSPLPISNQPTSFSFNLLALGSNKINIGLQSAAGNGFAVSYTAISVNLLELVNTNYTNILEVFNFLPISLSTFNEYSFTVSVVDQVFTIVPFLNRIKLGSFTSTLPVESNNMTISVTTDNGGPNSGNKLFLNNWDWYNINGSPLVAWQLLTMPYSSPVPSQVSHTKTFYQITTGTNFPIAIKNLFNSTNLSTKIGKLKEKIDNLEASYN